MFRDAISRHPSAKHKLDKSCRLQSCKVKMSTALCPFTTLQPLDNAINLLYTYNIMADFITLTPWHDFLSTIFELGIGKMDHDRGVSTKPPKIDVTLDQPAGGWSPKQRALLPDEIRDSTARHILMEFKYTQSLNEDTVHQAIGYAHFFRTTRKLKRNQVQMFILSSKTPQAATLASFQYQETEVSGVYRSSDIIIQHIPLLVLNQLRDTPHNALVKIFSSRKKEKAKAFLSLEKLKDLPPKLLIMLEVLRAMWSIPKGANMNEILTPKRVLEIGEEWKQYLLQNLPVEELDAYANPVYRQMLFEEGREEGREEGIEKGIISTKQNTFMMILEHKFGKVSDVIEEMITLIDDVDELDQWLNRALEAESLGDLWDNADEAE